MEQAAPESGSNKPLLVAIALVILLYAASFAIGVPQKATDEIAAASTAAPHDDHAAHATHATPAQPKPMPPYWMVLPFALLLGCIAIFPLAPGLSHWWEHNTNKLYIAGGLGVLTLLYYLLMYHEPIDRHFLSHLVVPPSEGALNLSGVSILLQNALLNEYVPFIILLLSLYTIAGGIRIQGDLRAHPLTNTTFIGIGAVLASLIGTTGAAMLLIRPLLETNRERKHIQHTVVIFIFSVCNCGGCLLPIGDPPLFLGYLQGVDFLWTLKLWPEFLFTNGMLLVVYFLWDTFIAYPKETGMDVIRDETRVKPLQFLGLWPNVLLLVGVVLCAALLDPTKLVPGTNFRPWLYLREVAQLGLVALSLTLGSSTVRQANKFTFGAIVEVAVLFLGIFICMQPALQILDVHGGDLGIDSPTKFFWASGTLSAVLDNAPTYLVFFEVAKAMHVEGVKTIADVAEHFLVGISLGSVYMGAMTYIGNGPNFMVKAIAESSGVKMPSFFGYMVYSIGILLPILVAMTLLFL